MYIDIALSETLPDTNFEMDCPIDTWNYVDPRWPIALAGLQFFCQLSTPRPLRPVPVKL